MVALDGETGDITLTSDLSEVTEDTLLTLSAIATDHGTPPLSDEGLGFEFFREGVKSTYEVNNNYYQELVHT